MSSLTTFEKTVRHDTGISAGRTDSGITTPDSQSQQQQHESKSPAVQNADLGSSTEDIGVVEEKNPHEQSDIVYHYLTWETDLPSPSNFYVNQLSAPQPPNLDDYVSPFLWSNTRKRMTVWLSSLITTLTAFTAGSYSPGTYQMQEEWGVSHVAALVGITTFTTGFAIAPMVLAPFSEIHGRRPVFWASGALLVVCQLCTALTPTYPGILLSRFFVGVGGSTFSTMGT